MKKSFSVLKAVFPTTIPVLTGYLILGAAYGMLMSDKGYGVLWSALMSMFAFCGSMQYVAITLLTTAFDPLSAFLLSLMVNARHIFYGISMLEKYRGLGKLRPFLIFALTDETYSIVSCCEQPETVSNKQFYFCVSFLDWIYWVAGTVIGALLGEAMTINTKGMDFALTALFIVLFIEQWKKPENRISCLIGLLCTMLCLLLFGEGSFVLPSMIGIALILIVGRKKICC